MPVEIALLQIANSLLGPIWKLTNACFIALPHAKSMFLPTQHKSGPDIILPGYSKSPEAGIYTVCILAFRVGCGSEFSDTLGDFPNITKQCFCSSSYLHSLASAALLMFAFVVHLSHICRLEF